MNAKQPIPVSCSELTHWDGHCRDFTPSGGEDGYDQWISECEDAARSGDAATYFQLECKRQAHIYLPGGRSGQRYGAYPKDPKNGGPGIRSEGTNQGASSLSSKTQTRLDQRGPDLEARTQSLDARGKWRTMEQRIREGLDQYSAGKTIFIVPVHPQGLIAAGVPQRAAEILTERAGNRQFRKSSSSMKELSPNQVLLKMFGAPLRLSNDGQYFVRGDGKPLRLLTIKHDDQPEKPYVNDTLYKAIRPLTKQVVSDPESRDRVASTVYQQVFGPRFEQTIQDNTQRVTTITAIFGDPNVDRTVVQGEFRKGEHSVSTSFPASGAQIDYRTLRSAQLTYANLPNLLARLVEHNTPSSHNRVLARMNPLPAIVAPSLDPMKSAIEQAGGALPVPGKPGKVFVWSKKRNAVVETTPARAASWAIIRDTAQKVKESASLKRFAQASAEEVRAQNPGLLKPSSQSNPKESVMFSSDDDYFMEQYSSSPYGAQQSIPAARRNPASDKQKLVQAAGKWVLKRAYKIMESGECSLSKAMKQAWAEQKSGKLKNNPRRKHAASEKEQAARAIAMKVLVRAHAIIEKKKKCSAAEAVRHAWEEYKMKKHPNFSKKLAAAAGKASAAPARRSGRRAAANPIDYSDPTQVRTALSRANFDYRDPTQVLTALGNPKQQVHYTSKGQPYVYVDGRPRFVKKSAARRNPEGAASPAYDPYALTTPDAPSAYSVRHPIYEQYIGQFSTSEPFTAGFQPMNRRNPKHKKAKRNPEAAPAAASDEWNASDYETHHPIYSQFVGQFGTNEAFTAGFQPMNRRNPGMTARFPSKCAHCGAAIERGEQIKDSGKRGPKGGKLMAHQNCGGRY